MPCDEVDPSLITSEPRKRKLTSYTTNEDNISADKEATVKRLKETVKPTMTVQSGVEDEVVRPPPKKTPPSISVSEPSDDDGDCASAEPRRGERSKAAQRRKKKQKKHSAYRVVDDSDEPRRSTTDPLDSADEEEARLKSRHRQKKSVTRSKARTNTPSNSDVEILEDPKHAEDELGQSPE
jgi:hypothetical protein